MSNPRSIFLARRLGLICTVMGLMLFCNNSAVNWAGTGNTITYPLKGVPPKSRLMMEVNTRWIENSGVRPVKLTFRPIGRRTFPADRTLEVTVRPKSWGGAFQGVTEVIQTVNIPEKASSAEVVCYLPVFANIYLFGVEVRERGRTLSDLCFQTASLGAGYRTGEDLPSMVVIDKDVTSIYSRHVAKPVTTGPEIEPSNDAPVPDLRKMVALFGASQAYGTRISTESLSWSELSELTTNVEYLLPSDLPQQRMGLTSVDFIAIDFEELVELAEQHPQELQLIRDWMILGGNVIVSQVGEEYSKLSGLDTLWKLSSATGPEQWTIPPPATRVLKPDSLREIAAASNGRSGQSPDLSDEDVLSASDADDLVGPGAYCDAWYFPRPSDYEDRYLQLQANRDSNGGKPIRLDFSKVPERSSFVVRRAHLGTLIAVSGEFGELDLESWNWMLNSMPNATHRWESRFGLSLAESNDGYWDFLIPGVGLPPVTAFHVLLTLFVIAIGPVNYFLLQRRRQLNWLLATVPLGAVITIVGLLVFALFTDGLASRGRVRSFTHIDQRTGDITSWSRQSYYAGVAPSSGLSYPIDAIVMPLEFVPDSERGVFSGSHRVLRVLEDQVRFEVGYFPSRTTVQYMVANAGQSTRRLQFDATRPSDGSHDTLEVKVTNQLGANIEMAFVRADDGTIFRADAVTDAASTTMRKVDEAALTRGLRDAFEHQQLMPPPGFDRTLMRDGLLGRGYGGGRGVSNRDGILERTMNRLGNGHGIMDQPNSYVAVVDRSIHTPLGLQDFSESNSLHVVTGRISRMFAGDAETMDATTP